MMMMLKLVRDDLDLLWRLRGVGAEDFNGIAKDALEDLIFAPNSGKIESNDRAIEHLKGAWQLRPNKETWRAGMSYHIVVDSGSTFTDVIVADAEGPLTGDKALPMPELWCRRSTMCISAATL